MSVQRIVGRRTKGWHARAHVTGNERLTRFFADGTHGGYNAAHEAAQRRLAGFTPGLVLDRDDEPPMEVAA